MNNEELPGIFNDFPTPIAKVMIHLHEVLLSDDLDMDVIDHINNAIDILTIEFCANDDMRQDAIDRNN